MAKVASILTVHPVYYDILDISEEDLVMTFLHYLEKQVALENVIAYMHIL